METKICFKCNKEKTLGEYYVHKQMADGHLNKCKDCTRNDSDKREKTLRLDENWVEKEKERARKKYYRLGYKDKHKRTPEQKKIIMDKYNKKYPEKIKAKRFIYRRIKKTKGIECHHWSYNEEHWIDIIELDSKIHAFIHRHLIYNQSTMMYEDKKGNLLSTKEKHSNYIKELLATIPL